MISPEEVDYLAGLARLEISVELKTKLAKDLESILGYVSELEAAKIQAASPAVDAYLAKNIFRGDAEALPPKTDGDFVKVKKIL